MKERLVIKNFGPIKSVDLELDKMTILIGEQATGKSTIAKVLAVCRNVFLMPNSNQSKAFLDLLSYWNIDTYLNKESYIYYKSEDFSKEFIGNKMNYVIISDVLKKINEETLSFYKNIGADKTELDDLDDNLISNINNNFNNSIESFIFIPTERGLQSIFSLGKSTINMMSDVLFEQLSKLSKISNKFKNEITIKPLGISFKNIKGESFIKKEINEKFYKLSNSASGFQSIIPIILSVNYFVDKHQKFIIEEPELNLFPKAQKKLMEFFVENINNNGHSFLLPTHSPYILSSIENLMYAYKLGNIENGIHKEKVKSIVDENLWINPNDVSVYYLSDGKAIDILYRKEALIDKDYIDSVSKIINDEFDELLNIEVEYEH
jgi:predicted ATPase